MLIIFKEVAMAKEKKSEKEKHDLRYSKHQEAMKKMGLHVGRGFKNGTRSFSSKKFKSIKMDIQDDEPDPF